jgi:acyl-CoA thioester hydrolase
MPPSEKPAELRDFPLVIEIPVHWGDQDAFGHVNHAVPLRWFESARVAYLEQSGLGYLMSGEGLGPIVASLTCHYRRQLRYPDVVHIGVRVAGMRRSSMTMEQAVHSKEHAAIAVEGTATIVIFDYQRNRPSRILPELRAAMEQFEGRRLAENEGLRERGTEGG